MSAGVNSPITNKPARFVTAISTADILEQYRRDYHLSLERYFMDTDSISIFECEQSAYRFYVPPKMGDAEFYASLQMNGDYYLDWKWENDLALVHILKNDHVLDVGCGNASFLKELSARGIKNTCGIDMSSNKLKYDDSLYLDIRNETIETFCTKNEAKFDVIVCFQILEHIHDVLSFFESCLKCLKPKGKLIIAVPNNNPYLLKYDKLHSLNLPPHHVGLWNKDSLIKTGKLFKLNPIDIKVDSISNYVTAYFNVQIAQLRSTSIVYKLLFSFRWMEKLFYKYLHIRRNKIEGRNLFVVFQNR